jgi:hypothetical protein
LLHRRKPKAEDEEHEDLGILPGATLTLLALIIGFSVSMASTRYDQCKNLEEAEAGTARVYPVTSPAGSGLSHR